MERPLDSWAEIAQGQRVQGPDCGGMCEYDALMVLRHEVVDRRPSPWDLKAGQVVGVQGDLSSPLPHDP